MVTDGPLVPFDAGKPSSPRIHDHFLGGKDNFAADREASARLAEVFPLTAVLARESREFTARAVRHAARQGVAQFIDVGCGMPASPATHEAALRAAPGARVAYVDIDPVVVAHAAARLARPGQVTAVPGDVRCPAGLLASPALTALIDTRQPYCVILAFILDFLRPEQAAQVMAELRDALPAGSFLALSIGIDQEPDLARDCAEALRDVARLYRHRREQVADYFTGLELVEPGMTQARYWRPDRPQAVTGPRPADVLAVLGRKPGHRPGPAPGA